GAELARRHRHRAAALQQIFERDAGLAAHRAGKLIESQRIADLVDQAELQVILQVLADAGRLPDDIDTETAEPFAAADPRQLQQLRRADGAGGENDLAARSDHPVLTADADLDADGTAILHEHALGLRAQDDSQIR